MTTETWNLLWSAKQNAFHIESMNDTLGKNLDAFFAKRHTDYVTLFVGTFDECYEQADHYRPMLDERERIRAVADAVIDAIK